METDGLTVDLLKVSPKSFHMSPNQPHTASNDNISILATHTQTISFALSIVTEHTQGSSAVIAKTGVLCITLFLLKTFVFFGHIVILRQKNFECSCERLTQHYGFVSL